MRQRMHLHLHLHPGGIPGKNERPVSGDGADEDPARPAREWRKSLRKGPDLEETAAGTAPEGGVLRPPLHGDPGGHLSIDHRYKFKQGKVYINEIEGFWSFAKERLIKHHGILPTEVTLLHQEMEWRYNSRGRDLFEDLIDFDA